MDEPSARLTDSLVRGYMRSQWANYRRSLNEFQAREELLSAASVYSCETGTSTPVCTYRDPARTIANCNPVVLFVSGEGPNIVLPEGGCDLIFRRREGETIAAFHNCGPDTLV